MLTITSVLGNIFHDDKLMNEFRRLESSNSCERLQISRLESERSRLRSKTDQGTDVGLVFDSEFRLLHGDVIYLDLDRIIIINQIPEKVICLKVKNNVDKNDIFRLLVTTGHIIGNRHRPIAIENDVIYFPIQANSEIDTFKGLFHDMVNHIEVSINEIIFQPEKYMNVHEH